LYLCDKNTEHIASAPQVTNKVTKLHGAANKSNPMLRFYSASA